MVYSLWFGWYSFLSTDLSNSLRCLGSYWLSFTDIVTTRVYSFVSLISKIILLELILPFSTLAKAETQCFVHLSFNSTFQVIYDISNDHQKLLIYFNDTAIVAFFRIISIWNK